MQTTSNTVRMLESPSKRLAMISELTIRERPTIPAVVIAVVLLFFTAAYTVLQSKARYGIPLRPFELLMATTAISRGYTWFRERSPVLDKFATKFSFESYACGERRYDLCWSGGYPGEI